MEALEAFCRPFRRVLVVRLHGSWWCLLYFRDSQIPSLVSTWRLGATRAPRGRAHGKSNGRVHGPTPHLGPRHVDVASLAPGGPVNNPAAPGATPLFQIHDLHPSPGCGHTSCRYGVNQRLWFRCLKHPDCAWKHHPRPDRGAYRCILPGF